MSSLSKSAALLCAVPSSLASSACLTASSRCFFCRLSCRLLNCCSSSAGSASAIISEDLWHRQKPQRWAYFLQSEYCLARLCLPSLVWVCCISGWRFLMSFRIKMSHQCLQTHLLLSSACTCFGKHMKLRMRQVRTTAGQQTFSCGFCTGLLCCLISPPYPSRLREWSSSIDWLIILLLLLLLAIFSALLKAFSTKAGNIMILCKIKHKS